MSNPDPKEVVEDTIMTNDEDTVGLVDVNQDVLPDYDRVKVMVDDLRAMCDLAERFGMEKIFLLTGGPVNPVFAESRADKEYDIGSLAITPCHPKYADDEDGEGDDDEE